MKISIFYSILFCSALGLWQSVDGASVTVPATQSPTGFQMDMPESICTLADLNAIRQNLKGKYRLDCDLVISANDHWTPIGASTTFQYFEGSFDGNGHTITLTSSSGGLFANLERTATVTNLKMIVNMTNGPGGISAMGVGAVAGYSWGRLEKIHVIGSIQTSLAMTGGIVGQNFGPLNNVSFSGTIRDTGKRTRIYPNDPDRHDTYPGFIGGIAATTNAPITKATVSAEIYSDQDRVGLVTAQLMRANIKDCKVNGSIQSNSGTADGGDRGGVAGLIDFTLPGKPTSIVNCRVNANLSGTSVGGIAGVAGGTELYLNRVSFEGSISASRNANGDLVAGSIGGLISNCVSCAPSIIDSFVRATLTTANSGLVGGIYGGYYPMSTLNGRAFSSSLIHVYSESILNGGAFKGGLFGYSSDGNRFRTEGVFWDSSLGAPNSAPLVWRNLGNWQYAQVDPGTGLGLSSSDMSSINTYKNAGYNAEIWDFSPVMVTGFQFNPPSSLPVTPILKR